MLLSKEIAISLNLTGCKLKQFISTSLRYKHVNLTPEQLLTMDLLWNDGPMSQQQLADAMQKDKNSIVQLVNALEKKGLIIRQRSEKDKRSNILLLTDKAQKIKIDTKNEGIRLLDKILEGIEEEELRFFLNTLNKIFNNMSTISKNKTD